MQTRVTNVTLLKSMLMVFKYGMCFMLNIPYKKDIGKWLYFLWGILYFSVNVTNIHVNPGNKFSRV